MSAALAEVTRTMVATRARLEAALAESRQALAATHRILAAAR